MCCRTEHGPAHRKCCWLRACQQFVPFPLTIGGGEPVEILTVFLQELRVAVDARQGQFVVCLFMCMPASCAMPAFAVPMLGPLLPSFSVDTAQQ